MPDRSRKARPRDSNQLGKFIVAVATGELDDHTPSAEEEGKDPAAVELGRKGGLKGGKARAKKLSAKQRKASAANAANARWKNRP